MRVGLMSREYPPYVYGGAGVHVEYLARELARTIEVEVHAWGETPADSPASNPNLNVHFEQPWPAITNGTDAKFKGALEALSLNLLQNLNLDKLDIVGVYPNYATAYSAWRGKAQQTVDNAQMRYFIVHLHRLLDPDATGESGH